ncbi:MAG: class I SAM-dependent methyltransferase [Actinobacteria bacterium]|nr:class I SAM-dependent methyltransferase [Actinomycetota bacterium]
MTAKFNPEQYKTTTRQQWEDAAEAWHRWGPTLESWLGTSTERMLEGAGVTEGSRVLDVAAGAGGQSFAAARRVGPKGRVLATDISPTILAYAAKAAAEAGIDNLETQTVDGEELDVAEAGFDAVISRVGLIYFPDQQRALAGMRRALRAGGRISAVVYSTPEKNEFFSIPVGVIRRRAQLPPPLPGQPGPFSLGGPGVIAQAFEQAGFHDVTVETVPAPLRMPTSADCVRFERDSFGALHQMLSGLSEAEREEAWEEIATELGRFESAEGFVGPCEMLVASGTK